MKATELRIGNLFQEQITKEILVVRKLLRDEIHFTGNFKREWQAEPIPLTEEWLLKFGFIKDKKYKHFILEISKSKEFILMFSEQSNNYFLCDTDVDTNIKYVHQLQNLFFALTGKELK